MKHIGLFEGIGGFSLAIEAMGWETIAWCEWNEFGRYVLSDKYPNAIAHGDITKTDFTVYRGKCDIVTGGFPCQPYSTAGKRLGKDDERHLWPEMLRAIREIGPRYVVGENVSGLISWNGGLVFDEVQADLEAAGYEVIPFVLPAAGVGAPHRRDRVWFVAYAIGAGRWQAPEGGLDTHGQLLQERGGEENTNKPIGIDEWQPTPHPRLQRPEDRQQQPMGPEQLCEERAAADTTSNRRERNGEGTEIEEGLQQGPESAGQLQRGFEGLCSNGITANTESISQREQANEIEPLTVGGKTWAEPCSISGGGIIADTIGGGQQGSRQVIGPGHSTQNGEGQSDNANNGNERSRLPTDWAKFPTQSPVCARNDGFSTESLRQRIREDSMGYLSEKEIDKIFSAAATQWRNESIKAAGNAIVPQVFLQICKAIQQFEMLLPQQ